MTYITSASSSCSAQRSSSWLQRVLSQLSMCLQTARSRRTLQTLDAAALRDIGISRQDALQEAARPFWDAPSTWRS